MRLEAASEGLVTFRLHCQCGPTLLVPTASLVVLLLWRGITGEREIQDEGARTDWSAYQRKISQQHLDSCLDKARHLICLVCRLVWFVGLLFGLLVGLSVVWFVVWLVGWFVGCLLCCLAGWLVCRLFGWLIGWFVGCLACCLAGWLVGLSVVWFVVWLVGWFVDCLAGWLVGLSVVWFVVWLVGWFVDCLAGWLVGLSVVWFVVWLVGWIVGCLVCCLAGWLVGFLVCLLACWTIVFELSLSFMLEGLVYKDLAFLPHPSFPMPPISLAMIRHSPSHWAPPISCGGPCSTPGPLFLQLFNLFLCLKFTARPSPPPPPQTNAAGVQFVVTAGRPVRTAGPAPGQLRALCIHETLQHTHTEMLQRFTFSACIRLFEVHCGGCDYPHLRLL